VYLVFNFFWRHYYIMIMIKIEMQYSGTASILLLNPHIPYRNMPQLYQLLRCIIASYCTFNPLYNSTNQQLFEKNFCNQNSYYENYGEFLLQMEANMCLPQNWHFLWWAKMNGTQRRALVSQWRMHCMYSSMAKGTSWAEVMSNSKEINAIVLTIVELCESDRQAVN